jgi:hypothetical protein
LNSISFHPDDIHISDLYQAIVIGVGWSGWEVYDIDKDPDEVDDRTESELEV